MFIYLNLPRPFWQIPDTDISLSRSRPMKEISPADLDAMSNEQKDVLKKSIEYGIVMKVSPDFIPKSKNAPENAKILDLPANEIQRRHVAPLTAISISDLATAKKTAALRIAKLEQWAELESQKAEPRQTLLNVFKNAIAEIHKLVPEAKLFQIEEDVIEDVVIQKPKTETMPAKKRGRVKKQEN